MGDCWGRWGLPSEGMPLKCGFCKACSQTSRLLALFHSQMVTGLLVPQTPILLVCSSPPGAWRMLDGYFLLFSVKPNIIRHQSTIQINPMPPIMPIGRQHDFLRILGRSIAGVRTLKTPCVWVRASGGCSGFGFGLHSLRHRAAPPSRPSICRFPTLVAWTSPPVTGFALWEKNQVLQQAPGQHADPPKRSKMMIKM